MPANLEDLPAEIKYMVLALLESAEIKALHSTSKSWRNVADERYYASFFSDFSVIIDKRGINIMEAVSQNECRKYIRTVSFASSYWFDDIYYGVDSAIDPHDLATARLSLFEASDRRLQWTKENATAVTATTAAIRRAMGDLENCTCVSLDNNWDLLNSHFGDDPTDDFRLETDTDDLPHEYAEYSYTVRGFIEHFVIYIILNAAAASRYIHEIRIPMGYIVKFYDVSGFERDHQLNKFRVGQLDRIQKICISGAFSVTSRGLGRGTPNLLSLFTSVESLEVDFEASDTAETYEGRYIDFQRLLIKGVRRLTLQYLKCNPEQFLRLVRDPRAVSIRELRLVSVTLITFDSALQPWIQLIKLFCGLELDSVSLLQCHVDCIELERKLPISDNQGLKYFDLNRSTVDRIVEEFVRDARGWNSQK